MKGNFKKLEGQKDSDCGINWMKCVARKKRTA